MREPGTVKRAPRVATAMKAVVVDSDCSEVEVLVTDISSGGFRLSTESQLRIGEYIYLRVPRYGDFPAQIRWCVGEDAGGVFLEPVKLD